jgi:hypothetical protein
MNKFRTLGFIKCDMSGVEVNNSLLGVVLCGLNGAAPVGRGPREVTDVWKQTARVLTG